MEGNINNVCDRNFTHVQKCMQWRKQQIWQKHRQMAGENLNEVTKGAPYKEEKLTKIANLAKFAVGLENI